MARFRTILCDPPWLYDNMSSKLNGAAIAHYAGMTGSERSSLPVADVAEKDAALLLWCTWPQLSEGLSIIEAWGFRYVSGFPWLKMAQAGTPRMGIGWHTRSVSEVVLIGVKGTCITPPVEKRQVGVIFSPIGRHSAKPDAQYDFAEAYGGPFLEIFARPDGGLFGHREGWVRIGNEITGRDVREDLRLLAESLP